MPDVNKDKLGGGGGPAPELREPAPIGHLALTRHGGNFRADPLDRTARPANVCGASIGRLACSAWARLADERLCECIAREASIRGRTNE